MGPCRVRYKYLLIAGILLSFVYVWMSLFFPPEPVLYQTGMKGHKHSDFSTGSGELTVTESVVSQSNYYKLAPRDYCGLNLDIKPLTDTSCQLKLPLKESCRVTSVLFSGKLRKCYSKSKAKHCLISDQKAYCNLRQCSTSAADMGYLDADTGLMVWGQYNTSQALSQAITALLDTAKHSHYVFIRCSAKTLTQLLVLPEIPKPSESAATSSSHININVLFVDSVSFYHFHRSLPKTLTALQKIKSPQTSVLSYPLFQSLKSRTYENMQALFGGEADSIGGTFGVQAMPDTALKLEGILKPLKDKGYRNLFMEDLCWLWEWGLSKDLLVHNKYLGRTQYWKNLLKAFDVAAIDSYGISPASCEVLADTGHPDPFHDVPVICYNGQYHHRYILDYLDSYQQARVTEGVPYSSVYACNVPHEEWGTRVQTLDSDLADHLTVVARQSNTLTILISDHGNTYGDFPQHYQQGRDEAYHPGLWMILPEKVKLLLGEQIMANLEENQARLVTSMDLHFLLKHIAAPSGERRGLISELSKSRDCSDLPLFHPNICICADKGDRPLSDTELALLAELASGHLTNKLIEDGGGIKKARCRVLLPISYSHPQSTINKDGSYFVSMDINYPSPNGDYLETIFVTVVYKPVSYGSNQAQLLAFERRSTYGVYRVCGDGPITESLCICETNKKYRLNTAESWLTNIRNDSALISNHESHKLNKCIYIIRYFINIKGSSVYCVNICADASYKLKVDIVEDATFSYSTFPSTGWHLNPRDITFLTIVYFLNPCYSLDCIFEFSTSVL